MAVTICHRGVHDLVIVDTGNILLHTVLTLWMFIVIMKWKHSALTSEQASWGQKAFVALGVIMDASYNYSPLGGSLALLQFPRRGEPLFTNHLKRLKKANLSKTRMHRYRTIVCKVYCYILDFWDVGHCS